MNFQIALKIFHTLCLQYVIRRERTEKTRLWALKNRYLVKQVCCKTGILWNSVVNCNFILIFSAYKQLIMSECDTLWFKRLLFWQWILCWKSSIISEFLNDGAHLTVWATCAAIGNKATTEHWFICFRNFFLRVWKIFDQIPKFHKFSNFASNKSSSLMPGKCKERERSNKHEEYCVIWGWN